MAPVSYENKLESVANGGSAPHLKIPLGQYVFERLVSSGTRTVFGVPGDFNLSLLEHMYGADVKAKGLKWVGTCNELNAAYAADGYSRYTNKIGCVITTYGVGELSALNGIAGAFAEDVKVLHIVGVTPSSSRSNPVSAAQNIHHLVPSLKNSNFEGPSHRVYHDMVKGRVSCSTEFLEDLETACEKIDKVITDIFRYSKPGYLFIPADFADKLVDCSSLRSTPSITLETVLAESALDQSQIESVAESIIEWIYQSKIPAIIGDVLCDRYGCVEQLRELVNKTQMWNFSSSMGKSILDESNSTFHGVYNGVESTPDVLTLIQDCDLILHFGVVKNEMNTGHYSYKFKSNAKLVEIHPEYLRTYDSSSGKEMYLEGVSLTGVLQNILAIIDVNRLHYDYPIVQEKVKSTHIDGPESLVTQSILQEIFPKYLNPGDVFVVETGSFQFGVRDYAFPTNLKYISQAFYLSIGMALPSALGTGCGMRDYPRHHIYEGDSRIPQEYVPKLILAEGDGAAQMTIQELTSFLRYDIPVEIFIWNNDGYTVERAVKGPTRPYNDIMPWQWTKLFHVLGDLSKNKTDNVKVECLQQLNDRLRDLKCCKDRSSIHLTEVTLGIMDIPEQLKVMVAACQHK